MYIKTKYNSENNFSLENQTSMPSAQNVTLGSQTTPADAHLSSVVNLSSDILSAGLSYINAYARGDNQKSPAATKIQRAFRSHQIKRKLKNINPEEIIRQKEKKYSISIQKAVRQPLENLTRNTDWISNPKSPLGRAQKAITQAAKLGSYEKFKLALRSSFCDTLQSIHACPSDQREYVIVVDDNSSKSSHWVTAHLHDLMSVHSPKDIVSWDDLSSFLKKNPEIKHIVMVDDGVYSGDQASSRIKSMKQEKNHRFHVTIPYMTAYGKMKISEVLQKKQCEYQMHDRQIMHSYHELVETCKIFSVTGKVMVNKSLVSGIKNLANEENSLIKAEINQKLLKLKKMAASKNNDRVLYEKIWETMAFVDNYCKDLNKKRAALNGKKLDDKNMEFLQQLIKLMQELLKTMKPEYSRSNHKELLQAYLNKKKIDYSYTATQLEQNKTASWFAHKGADNVSTCFKEMEKIAGQDPIVPYKDGMEIRKARIVNIKKNMGANTLEKTVMEREMWLNGRIDFVQTNRGFFLLGNSYAEETSAPSLMLHINGKTIELGGTNGEYQYQLKKGDLFEVEDPMNQVKVRLKLDDSGKLQITKNVNLILQMSS